MGPVLGRYCIAVVTRCAWGPIDGKDIDVRNEQNVYVHTYALQERRWLRHRQPEKILNHSYVPINSGPQWFNKWSHVVTEPSKLVIVLFPQCNEIARGHTVGR